MKIVSIFVCLAILVSFSQAGLPRQRFGLAQTIFERNVQQGPCTLACTLDADCSKFFGEDRTCQNGQCVLGQADGSSCTNPSQCSSRNCINGVCGIQRSLNCNCTVNAECITGVCTNSTCVQGPSFLKNPGSLCVRDTDCRSNNCQNNACALSASGAPCVQSSECVSGFFCSSQVCTAKRDVGQACLSSGDCLDTLFCNFTLNGPRICTQRRALGQVCDTGQAPCLLTAFCNQTCFALRQNAEACTADIQCFSNNCQQGVCFELDSRNIGESCVILNSGASNCRNNAACVGGVCSNTVTPNGVCLRESDCDRQDCSCFNVGSSSFTCNGLQSILSSPCVEKNRQTQICILQNNCSDISSCQPCHNLNIDFICTCFCDPLIQGFGNNLGLNPLKDTKPFPVSGSCSQNRNGIQHIRSCDGTRNSWSTAFQLCSIPDATTGSDSNFAVNTKKNTSILLSSFALVAVLAFIFF